jgi:Domain of unknown function (DUF389)
MAYGSYIHDTKLRKKAFATECISLVVCVVFGVIIGACTGWTDLANTWPNSEMYNRGTWQNLLVGCPVSFLAGRVEFMVVFRYVYIIVAQNPVPNFPLSFRFSSNISPIRLPSFLVWVLP